MRLPRKSAQGWIIVPCVPIYLSIARFFPLHKGGAERCRKKKEEPGSRGDAEEKRLLRDAPPLFFRLRALFVGIFR